MLMILSLSAPLYLRLIVCREHWEETLLLRIWEDNIYLGLKVTHCDVGLTLIKQKYSLEMLHRAGVLKCKTATTPMADQLTGLSGDYLTSDNVTEYHNIVGGLQNLTIRARLAPIISFYLVEMK
jgi:hypothetical protein